MLLPAATVSMISVAQNPAAAAETEAVAAAEAADFPVPRNLPPKYYQASGEKMMSLRPETSSIGFTTMFITPIAEA